MARAVSATHTAKGVDAPRSASIDLRQVTPDIEKVRLALDSVASDLRSLWSQALVRGDLGEIERLVGASHACTARSSPSPQTASSRRGHRLHEPAGRRRQ